MFSIKFLTNPLPRFCTKYPNKVIQASVSNFKRSQELYMDANEGSVLSDHLKEDQPLSKTQWTSIRANLLAATRAGITDYNIDAIIVGKCLPNSQVNVAKSYMEYLRSTGRCANLATIGRYLKLLYYAANHNYTITATDKQEIIDLYTDIKQVSSILDATTCENLIHALILTDAWAESLSLLDMIKITSTPSTSPYNVIIAKLFTENHMETGWKLLNEMVANDRSPNCNVFLSYMQKVGNEKLDEIEKMLAFIGDNRIFISRKVAKELHTIYRRLGYECKFTNVQMSGKCNACRQHLLPVQLSATEFKQLSHEFMDRVLVRDNVFLKTSPGELEKFHTFIDKNQPYDCVIDGLNVAYSRGSKMPIGMVAKLTADVLKYFVRQHKRVLVIGREHMNNWPKPQLNYIRKNSHLFLTANLSQDDPFVLWATLKGGPSTDFCSRDLMRSHAHLLGIDLKILFRRWQQEHQYHLEKVQLDESITVRQPVKFNLHAHKVADCWHIPFVEEYMPKLPDSFETQPLWLCMAMPSKLA